MIYWLEDHQRMKIKAIFHGILVDWVGIAETEMTLPDEATLGDLLYQIRKAYGSKMPALIQGKDQAAFNQAFWAVRGSEQLNEYEVKLKDGDEIRFFLPLAGG
jgi:molybdopterin converting factor small subunit